MHSRWPEGKVLLLLINTLEVLYSLKEHPVKIFFVKIHVFRGLPPKFLSPLLP